MVEGVEKHRPEMEGALPLIENAVGTDDQQPLPEKALNPLTELKPR